MKNTVALAVLLLFTSLASAQSIGFNASRSISTLCPDYATFKSTLNHSYGFGFYRMKQIGTGSLQLRTGVNMVFMRSCLSVTNDAGNSFLIPEKFNYVDIPILLQQDFFRYSRLTRKASHYSLQGGLHLSYLFHENGFEQRVGHDYKTNPLNLGASVAFQWIKPVKWNSAFAIGPEAKILSTGEEHAKVAIMAGLKLGWRFGNI